MDSEKKARDKLENILSSGSDIGNLELSDIMDMEEIKSMMDDFYRITKVPAAIMDNHGNVVFSNGLQDICTKFHWNNPETEKHCAKSRSVQESGFTANICGNHLYHMTAPVRVNNRQLGYLLIGQFLLENEKTDPEIFRRQAHQYGFEEKEYLAALAKVPRISREKAETVMSFYVKFADMLSLLSFRNVQLARSLMQAENTKMLLKSSIEGSKEIIMAMLDKNYRYLFFNRAHKDFMKKLYGQEPAIGQSVFEKIKHEEDRKLIKENLDRALAGESHYLIHEYGDKKKIYFESFFSPIYNNPGEVIGATAFSRDISGRMRIEKALEASEARNKAMLSNISDVVLILDREGRCKYVSPNAEEKIGWKPKLNDDLIALRTIHPNDRGKIKSEFRSLLGSPGSKLTTEIRYLGSDAKYRYLELTGVNLIFDPNIRGILVNFHDITERKIKEKEIVYLTEHSTLTGLYNRRYFDLEKRRMDNADNLPLSVIIGDINGLKLINDALGHAEGDKMIIEIAGILKKCTKKRDVLARTGGDEFSILLPRTSSEEVYAIIKKIHAACREHKTKSEIYYTSISMGYATKTRESESFDAKIKEAEDNMYKRKLLEHKSLHSSIISSIKTTMLEKDFQTEEHAERLVLLSSALGHALNITSEQMDELELLSTLHDIGKIVVEDKVLKKKGTLAPDEWRQLRKHPEVGYRIALASPELIPIAEYILCHHERWDGKGYPQGLSGEEIPLLSRIIALTDSYDAMTQDRPYRKAMSKEKAIEEIRKNAGGQFDPGIAEVFINDVLLNEDY